MKCKTSIHRLRACDPVSSRRYDEVVPVIVLRNFARDYIQGYLALISDLQILETPACTEARGGLFRSKSESAFSHPSKQEAKHEEGAAPTGLEQAASSCGGKDKGDGAGGVLHQSRSAPRLL
jgi:hypothetical protein